MWREPTSPEIEIIQPQLDGKNPVRVTTSELPVEFEVTDESKLSEVTVNGQPVISQDGRMFKTMVRRQTREQRIELAASDEFGAVKKVRFDVEFQEASVTTGVPPKTTPVSKMLKDTKSTVKRTVPLKNTENIPGTAGFGELPPTTNTAENKKENAAPRITFVNGDLDANRPYTASTGSFQLAVYILDDSPLLRVEVDRESSNVYETIGELSKVEPAKYEIDLLLTDGLNNFRIEAEDKWGNLKRQTFTIILQTDGEGPKIELSRVGDQFIRSSEAPVVDVEEILIRGSVSDVSRVRSVQVNGTEAILQAEGGFETNVSLDYGRNAIRINATDEHNNSNEVDFTIYHRPNRAGKDFAIFFATDEYHGVKDEYGDWRNLTTAIKDAEAVAQKLKENYGFQVRVFENYTRRQLLDTLYKYKDGFEGIQYTSGSQLLIFFSGHGYYHEDHDKGYLITADTDGPKFDGSMASALDHKTLRDQIDLVACERILVMLDTCYSGTFDPEFEPSPLKGSQMKGPRLDMSLLQTVNAKLELPARWYLTAAGTEYVSEYVSADSKDGYSPFATAFLEALGTGGGDDFLLGLEEVWEKVRESKNAPIYDKLLKQYEQMEHQRGMGRPEPRKGRFGKKSYEESDFLLFPIVR